MKAEIIGLEGKKIGDINLPDHFNTQFRPDVIKRAVVSSWKNAIKPYGSKKGAGNRSSAKWDGTRRGYGHGFGWGHSRVPRLMLRGGRRVGKTMNIPSAVGGREAHPPKTERKWAEKINKKEKKLAINSAIAATADEGIVAERGHKFSAKLPLVVDSKLEEVSKTKDLLQIFSKIGVSEDLSRIEKKERAGKGTMRGRPYKIGKSVLIILGQDRGIGKAASNILGVEISEVSKLNIELLAPGSHPGRLVIWTESAIKKMEGEN